MGGSPLLKRKRSRRRKRYHGVYGGNGITQRRRETETFVCTGLLVLFSVAPFLCVIPLPPYPPLPVTAAARCGRRRSPSDPRDRPDRPDLPDSRRAAVSQSASQHLAHHRFRQIRTEFNLRRNFV